VAATAAGMSDGDPRGKASVAACNKAFFECLLKRRLTVVGPPRLASLVLLLKETPAFGPIYGLPNIGDADFTPAGAKLYQETREALPVKRAGPRYFEVHEPSHRLFFLTKKDAEEVIGSLGRRQPKIRWGKPTPLDRWRVYWWLEYPQGYFVEELTSPVTATLST
jgi:hypothetical protein